MHTNGPKHVLVVRPAGCSTHVGVQDVLGAVQVGGAGLALTAALQVCIPSQPGWGDLCPWVRLRHTRRCPLFAEVLPWCVWGFCGVFGSVHAAAVSVGNVQTQAESVMLLPPAAAPKALTLPQTVCTQERLVCPHVSGSL